MLHLEPVSPAAVCFDPVVAVVLVVGGLDVVLCGLDDAEATSAVFRARAGGGGRIAVFVGDPSTAADAALAMARELFGGEAVVVGSLVEARNLTELPGSRST